MNAYTTKIFDVWWLLNEISYLLNNLQYSTTNLEQNPHQILCNKA